MAIRHRRDGGWGWIIVLGATMTNFLFAGYVRAFGIFFSAYQSNFGGSASQTALVSGVRGVIGTITCLVAIPLIKRFTERAVVMVGGCFIALSFILCVFANSMTYVIFVNGVLCGLGTTPVVIAGQLIVGKYFDKRKSLATTLGFAGAGVGQIALSPLLVYWLQEYGIYGMLLLFGGLTLNFLVIGAMYTPFEKFEIYHKSSKQFQEKEETDAVRLEISMESINRLAGSSKESEGSHRVSLNQQNESDASPPIERSSSLDATVELLEQMPESEKDNDQDRLSDKSSVFGIHGDQLFISCSLSSVCVATEDIGLHTDGNPNNEIPQKNQIDTAARARFPFCTKLSLLCRGLVDLSIFKNVRFTLYFIASGIGFGAFISQSIYLIPRALEQGVQIEKAAFLLSAVGAAEIVGRVIMGIIADIECIGPIKILVVYCSCMAVANALLPLCDSFATLTVYAVVFGLLGSAAHTMNMPIILTVSSRDMLLVGISMTVISQAVCAAVLQVLMGLLRDNTGTYENIFYTCAAIQITVVTLMGVVLYLNTRDTVTKQPDECDVTNT